MWVLILFAHVGMLGDGNSNSLAMIDFTSEANCKQALVKAVAMSSGSTKVIKVECVKK